ncbi:MAG: isocitrate lyase/phosphoenolpyruvate mutase family protein [Pseudomonadota bacterium]
MNEQQRKCLELKALHSEGQAWVLPNPWDTGSARVLEQQGFKALATSSAALAGTLGCGDGDITLAQKLAHCEQLAANTAIPISVDFEDGFADAPAAVALNITRLAETGVAGCSIEDYSRSTRTLFEATLAEERMAAAVEAVAGLDCEFQLVARAENLLRGVDDLDDTLARLSRFAELGAHVVYAPGLKTLDQVRAVRAATQRPVNVLWPFFPGTSIDALGEAGATRLSLGSVLYQQMTDWLVSTSAALG